jgi:thiol-disulfide isomerase/thioredoxin
MLRNRAFLALVFLTVLASGNAQKVVAQQPQAQPSRVLPDVLIKTTDAKGINLRKYRGKELILVLFSTSECPDCLRTVGIMNKIQQDYGARGLQVIGAGVNRNAPFMLASWVQRFRPGFPVGFLDQDPMLKLTAINKGVVPVVPMVLFVDAIGTVRVQYLGDSPVLKSGEQEKALSAIAKSLLDWNAAHYGPKAAPKPAAPPADKPPDKVEPK